MPILCPVFGVPMTHHRGRSGGDKYSPSLDRIVPSLGYVPGNVQVMSHLANNMKSYATTEEMVTFAKYVLRTYNDSGIRKATA